MDEKNQYKILIATLLLIGCIVLLLSPPELLFQRGVMVDTTPYYNSPDKTWVRTRMELGDKEAINALPLNVGNWSGFSIEVKKNIFEALGADTIIERAYRNTSDNNIVFFVIIRSKNTSAFHDPKVCYRYAGWNIINETQVSIKLNSSIWYETQGLIDSKREDNERENVEIKVNKLLIERNEKQQLILYFYLKEFILSNSPEEITLVRAETLIDSMDKSMQRTSNLLGEILPYLFIPATGKGEPIAIQLYNTYGFIGIIIESILLLLPIFYILKLVLKNKSL